MAIVLPAAMLPRLQLIGVAVVQVPWLGVAAMTDAALALKASVTVT